MWTSDWLPRNPTTHPRFFPSLFHTSSFSPTLNASPHCYLLLHWGNVSCSRNSHNRVSLWLHPSFGFPPFTLNGFSMPLPWPAPNLRTTSPPFLYVCIYISNFKVNTLKTRLLTPEYYLISGSGSSSLTLPRDKVLGSLFLSHLTSFAWVQRAPAVPKS